MISMHADEIAAVSVGPSGWESISTDGIKASERREFWQARTGSLFGSYQLEVRGAQAFNASFEYTSIADLILCRLSADVPHRVTRTGASVRRDDRGYAKAVMQTRGCSVLEQNGRTTLLRPTEWTIFDTAKPHSITIPERAEMFMLLIPRQKILTRNFDLQDVAGRRFSGRQGVGKLMWNLIPEAFEQIPAIRKRASYDVADMLAQMMRLAILDSFDECLPADSKDALRERVKLYIESHLRDADLSISKLARVAHCTKRYLHMAFQPEKSSISEFILKLRLERCFEDLRSPSCAQRSITDIAYSWGFNNSNHFSRCFKQVYGICPRHSRLEFGPLLAHGSERHRKAS
jgi:AraC-like DNA-binding protein